MIAAAQLIDATKKYGAVEALRGVTIDIELGEVRARRPRSACCSASASRPQARPSCSGWHPPTSTLAAGSV
jgi:hypothetical protein